jgi:methylmalonyl-CoA/ethylmalonyl-CoA epimerase
MINGLDHLGIAVSDLDGAIAQWTQITGGKLVHRECVESQRVDVAVIEIGSVRVELLSPTSPDSPVAKFIASRGPGLHHVALQSDSAQGELDRCAEQNARLIDRTVRPGAENSRVGFLHPHALGGVLLEFVDHSTAE